MVQRVQRIGVVWVLCVMCGCASGDGARSQGEGVGAATKPMSRDVLFEPFGDLSLGMKYRDFQKVRGARKGLEKATQSKPFRVEHKEARPGGMVEDVVYMFDTDLPGQPLYQLTIDYALDVDVRGVEREIQERYGKDGGLVDGRGEPFAVWSEKKNQLSVAWKGAGTEWKDENTNAERRRACFKPTEVPTFELTVPAGYGFKEDGADGACIVFAGADAVEEAPMQTMFLVIPSKDGGPEQLLNEEDGALKWALAKGGRKLRKKDAGVVKMAGKEVKWFHLRGVVFGRKVRDVAIMRVKHGEYNIVALSLMPGRKSGEYWPALEKVYASLRVMSP